MKPQDLIFIVILIGLLFTRKPKLMAGAGITCLIISIPLFSFWIFFTAQRLTYYSLGFFLAAAVLLLINIKRD